MNFIENVKQRAKKQNKTIVLPEAEDIRTLEATQTVLKEQFAKIVLIGNKEKILEKAKENHIDIEGAKIIEPEKSGKSDSGRGHAHRAGSEPGYSTRCFPVGNDHYGCSFPWLQAAGFCSFLFLAVNSGDRWGGSAGVASNFLESD